MRLDNCRPGQSGTVLDVDYQGPTGQRLLEMGLMEGTAVRLVRVASLGCPMQFEINGFHLSLRRNEAARVRIKS